MLAHTLHCLEQKKRLTVAYLGGSITEGAGASAPQTCWASRITAWLRETWPDCSITAHNAGVGGTGSDLGVFRCDRDILSHQPDLLIVEFAVNDYPLPEEGVLTDMEGIFRKVRTACPACDILYAAFANKQMMEEAYDKGNTPRDVEIHQQLAAHYGVPACNPGRALWETIRAEGCPAEDYLPDATHPNDRGYQFYFEQIRDFFLAELHTPGGESQLPEPLSSRSRMGARLVSAYEADAPGWRACNEPLAGRYPHYISAELPGTELAFSFRGDAIGLYWLMAKDAGNIEWSVDGSTWECTSAWDKYCLRFNRANRVMLRQDLPDGAHVLRVRVSADKAEQSEGTAIRIGAFLVNDG